MRKKNEYEYYALHAIDECSLDAIYMTLNSRSLYDFYQI
jgi:hypothetical protein